MAITEESCVRGTEYAVGGRYLNSSCSCLVGIKYLFSIARFRKENLGVFISACFFFFSWQLISVHSKTWTSLSTKLAIKIYTLIYVLHISTGVGLLDFEDLCLGTGLSIAVLKEQRAILQWHYCFVTTFLSCHRKNSETRQRSRKWSEDWA